MKLKMKIILFSAGLFLMVRGASGQDGTGLPFLKIGIGARQAGMGNVFTGVGDDVYTIYWNPGGLGHLRRWQWSAAYNRWFTDIYQANLTLARQFRLFGSRKTTMGFSLQYLGMPEWDATGGKEAPVSADHLVVGLAFGQRLDWLSRYLAVGLNVKTIMSRFDQYSAKGLAFDTGLLVKPPRFNLGAMGFGIFDYGIFSAGFSMLHLGTKMKFDQTETTLPYAFRAGASLHMGRYMGFSLLMASDYVKYNGEDGIMGVGAELWWRRMLGLRAGYQFNGPDLGDFSFGIGFRIDDVTNTLLGLPTRYGDAFEINIADVNYGDVLQQTYRGSLSHYPIAPEPFDLEMPEIQESGLMNVNFSQRTEQSYTEDGENRGTETDKIKDGSGIRLSWEKAFDPDPFDRVRYLVAIDMDRNRIEHFIRWVEKDLTGFLNSSLKDSLLICDFSETTDYVTKVYEGGEYFWAVAAYDLGHHAQLAEKGKAGSYSSPENMGTFVVATPDLVADTLRFVHSEWITTTPEQGTLHFRIYNRGTGPASVFRIRIEDSYTGKERPNSVVMLLDTTFSELWPGQDTTFALPWMTDKMGPHAIRLFVDPDTSVFEINKSNNIRVATFVSIPKGTLSAPDSVEIMATGYDFADVPFVPEVYFKPFSSEVDSIFMTEHKISYPVLQTLVERLDANPDVVVEIRGYIDNLTGEKDVTLADKRAVKVKDKLTELGAKESQLKVITGHDRILGRRRMPVNPQDAEWVMEQYRMVSFEVPRQYEEAIFKPFQVAVDTTVKNGINFDLRVVSPGRTADWEIRGQPNDIEVSTEQAVHEDSLWGLIPWDATDRDRVIVPRNQRYTYELILTDTLGRIFRTKPDAIYLDEKRTIRRREVFGAAKFAQVEPVYQFYWDRMMIIASELVANPNMRVRFEGHACAIGPEAVNEKLSIDRATRFVDAFLVRIKENYREAYNSIVSRIDPPVGYGETQPLSLAIKGQGEVLLGDNQTPVGRYLNRRIMVLLYKENE